MSDFEEGQRLTLVDPNRYGGEWLDMTYIGPADGTHDLADVRCNKRHVQGYIPTSHLKPYETSEYEEMTTEELAATWQITTDMRISVFNELSARGYTPYCKQTNEEVDLVLDGIGFRKVIDLEV